MGGAALGALFSGALLSKGRWNCLVAFNFVLILGSTCTIFFDQLWLLCIGRFLFGISAGAFTVICPKYIAEVSPTEYTGFGGAMFQLVVCLGIFLGLILISMAPEGHDLIDVENDHMTSRIVLYILMGFPLVISFLQLSLLVCVFRYDTPKMIKESGKD